MTMPHMMNCGHSDTGWCLDCVRELHDRAEKADTAAEVLGQRALNIERRWIETFEKRAARENAMLEEAIDDFCDTVLAKLADLGVSETDNCDGDEDVSTILAGWINSRIEEVRDQLSALIDTAERTLDAIPHGSDRYDLAMRLEAARAFLAGRAAGVGGVENYATPKGATENVGVQGPAACGRSPGTTG